MSSVTLEWITTGLFFLCFAAAAVLETLWLAKKGWATYGRSAAFVMLSDMISLFVGFVVPFVILGTIIALAWSGGLSEVKGGDAGIWAAIVFAVIFPPIFLFLTKRVFLALFKIRSGRDAWLFSLAAVLISMAISFLPPIIFFYVGSKLI